VIIVHLIDSLDSGGMERMLISLAQKQLGAGHVVHIVCLLREGTLANLARASGISVTSCDKRAGVDPAALSKIRRTLIKINADVVHSHNPVPHYYGVLATVLSSTTVHVNTRHDMGEHNVSRKLNSLIRLSMRGTKAAVSVCKKAQGKFLALKLYSKRQSHTIANGIATAKTLPRSQILKEALCTSFGWERDTVVFVSVGRLEPIKGLDLMLDAFQACHAVGEPVGLVMIGDGSLKTALAQRAQELGIVDRIRFLGHREDIPQLLASADIFLQSSISEGYSLALVEASCAGLPVLATDVGGNSEIVTQGETGFLSASGDVKEYANWMNQLVASKLLRNELGDKAKSWGLQFGSDDAMHEKYLSLYKKVSGRR
jgi:glycosyltransferase involved in cell wall biosynthesis